MIRSLIILLGLLLAPNTALAHKASDSYLTIRGEGDALTLRWDIALRDLDHAVGLDGDGDGAVTWGELAARHAALEAYGLSRLRIAGDGQACAFGSIDHLVDRHSDGAYAVMSLPLDCPVAPSSLSIDYDFFFDLDPQHRGLISVAGVEGGGTTVVSPDQRRAEFSLEGGAAAGFAAFFFEGVHHLIGGADHLLFLLVVMLPIAFGRSNSGRERREPRVDVAFVETAKILTAFTIAHGLTLSAAVLDYATLPSRPVEVLIALSIAIAAIDNIHPFLGHRRWLVAGGFGLIHGFGFASVLGPLDLPPAGLALALLGFNLGIEAAQLMIAFALLAVARLLPARPVWIPRAMRAGGSVTAMALAGAWIVDRSFDFAMMPF